MEKPQPDGTPAERVLKLPSSWTFKSFFG
jgi:hypothetical protein